MPGSQIALTAATAREPRQGGVTRLGIGFTTRNDGFVHEGVYRRLRGLIVSGALAKGTRIASSRKLARDLRISRNSVLTAIDRLVADGWLEARDRSGVYVTYSGPRVIASVPLGPPDTLRNGPPFALGWAADIFPVQIWSKFQSRRWRAMPETLLQQGDIKGLPALRAAIAAHVTLRRGLECSPSQVIVTTCIPAAINLAIDALGLSGKEFWIENPCCQSTYRALLRSRIQVVPIPVDQQGANIEYGTMKARRAAAALVSPASQAPLGVPLGRHRRHQLGQWAEHSGAWIFEDDFNWNGDGLGTQSPPFAAFDRDRTIYFNSFNNLLFPGLRVAYLVVPCELIDRFGAIRNSEGDVNAANQMILADFMEAGHLDSHLRRLDECNRERRAALAASIEQELSELLYSNQTLGGYYVCTLRHHSESATLQACAQRKLIVAGMSSFYLSPPVRNEIVLGFSQFEPKALLGAASTLRAALESTPLTLPAENIKDRNT